LIKNKKENTLEIQNLKINSYGNLKNKEIDLKNKINIIYGKNESGKSTLLNFIKNSFYGISKNKNGRDISDYEKYKPWSGEEFSGKIKYRLNNGEEFEIYRDFHKKNPQIFNQNLEEISKHFSIDKKDGNQFFYEQTKMDETTFLSTVVSMQQEVKLGPQNQALLIQRIANLAGTGDDTISYKKLIEKLNKKQLEEIGTQRTQEKPINIIDKKMREIEMVLAQLAENENKKYAYEIEKNNLQETIQYLELKNTLLKKLKIIQDKNKIEKEKLEIKNTLKKENEEKIKLLNDKKIENENTIKKIKNTIEKNKAILKINKNKKIKNIVFYGIIFIFNIFLNCIFKNTIGYGIGMAIFLATTGNLFFQFHKIKKENAKIKHTMLTENYEEIEKIKEKNYTEISILEKNNQEIVLEIEKIKEKIYSEITLEKEKIKKEYSLKIKNNELQYILNNENIEYELEENYKEYNQENLKLHSIELDRQTIMPKLEKMVNLKEEWKYLEERKKELIEKNTCIEIAKECLEKAYAKMRNNVTPKLTQNVSKQVAKFSGGKYDNIHINAENKVVIENKNGEYIPVERLSIGTIDQIYLALRLAMLEELSEETMPILLDESFAYYDDERMANILQFLAQEACKNQVLIFTCGKREIKILENQNIPYNLVEL